MRVIVVTSSVRPSFIIVVDDDPALLRAISFSLEAEGFAVESHGTAHAFEASALASAACMVIDQRLPDAFGLDVLDELRRRGVRTPAVLITSDPPPPVQARAKALQTEIVEKPGLGADLVRAVRAAIAKGPTREDS